VCRFTAAIASISTLARVSTKIAGCTAVGMEISANFFLAPGTRAQTIGGGAVHMTHRLSVQLLKLLWSRTVSDNSLTGFSRFGSAAT
jgi:hypothetical protein